MDSVVYTQNEDSFECESPVLPRIADQYQVEIPVLIAKRHYALCTESQIDTNNHPSYQFLIALPIPVMQITDKIENPTYKTPKFSELESIKQNRTFLESEDLNLKVVPVEIGPGYCFVPGTNGDFWSKIEKDSFVLGLYVFEKNFDQVKRFVRSKKMEDILAFYYGEFYRSNEYQQWSACRKSRSRKFVCGQRMFIGQRQQEFLLRLLACVSVESHSVLVEVSNTFNEGNMSLEEYVSTLRSVVGLNILVEAMGIVKRKQNLPSQKPDTSKSNQISKLHTKIPIGKACSSLTPQQIIGFLTGDYRLSKARSNDLFWEAVWPLLLAQGWHSEESAGPGNYAASTSKHSLVFLVPGVSKFSRKLMKGIQYFDSVTDVLSKVALNPNLLEVDKNGVSTAKMRQLCYLQPRTPCMDTDVIKFDVKTCHVRESRNVPLEISKSGSCEDSDITECAKAVIFDQEEGNRTKQPTEINFSDSENSKSLKKRKIGRPKREQDCSSVHKFSSTGSSNGCLTETHENNYEKPQPTKPLFDLNLPPPEVDEPEPEPELELNPVPEPELNCQRQGKRNRPPTMKALEALANGLLTRNKRRKNDGANDTRASGEACTESGATGPSNGPHLLTANGDTCCSSTVTSFGDVLYMMYESKNN